MWRSVCSSGRLLASGLQPAMRVTQRHLTVGTVAQAAAAVSLRSLEVGVLTKHAVHMHCKHAHTTDRYADVFVLHRIFK